MKNTVNFSTEPDWIACPKCKAEVSKLVDSLLVCYDCYNDMVDTEKHETKLSQKLGAKALSEFQFDKFVVTKANKEAFEICKSFDPETDNLFLWGPKGTGKTHLAYSIAYKYLKQDKNVLVYKMPMLMRQFRGVESSEETALLNRLTAADVLILDEIGLDRGSEHVNKIIYEIVDYRQMELKNGLILTGNLSLQDYATQLNDTRVIDRLAGSFKIVKFQGESWRTKSK